MKPTGDARPAKSFSQTQPEPRKSAIRQRLKQPVIILKKVEKKDATATEEGNSTYWFCDKCNKYFSDAKAETEIKKEDTVLAKLSTVNKKETEASSAKTANATKVTSTTDKTTKSSPKTGDSTDVQLYVILMIVSIGAAAGAGAKRKLKTQR